MYGKVKFAIAKEFGTTMFLLMSTNKVTTIDNGSWISIYAYIVKNWVKALHLISL
jgi:hypothetical protein